VCFGDLDIVCRHCSHLALPTLRPSLCSLIVGSK
jgi:hypothetical protein